MSLFNIGAGGGGNVGDATAGYIKAPHLPYIGDFQFCAEPVTISSGTITTSAIDGYRHNLIYGSFPLASKVGRYAFFNQGDAYIYLPNLINWADIGEYAFYGLKEVCLPQIFNISYIHSNYFDHAGINLPMATSIDFFNNAWSKGVSTTSNLFFKQTSLYLPNLNDTLALSAATIGTTSRYALMSHTTQNPFYGCTKLIAPNLYISWNNLISTYSGVASYYTFNDILGPNITALDCTLSEITKYMFCFHYNYASNNISNNIQSLILRGSNLTYLPGPLFSSTIDTTSNSNFALKYISISALTSLGDGLAGCANLTEVSFPALTTIESYGFAGCANLISVSFPLLTTIGSSGFRYAGLMEINAPLLTTIGSYGFANTNFTEVSFSSLASIGNYIFYQCYDLRKATLEVANMAVGCFYSCKLLSEVILPNVTFIGDSTFTSCTELISVNLTGVTTVPQLSPTAFDYNFKSYGSLNSIYVPASLYTNFTTATNWATYSKVMVSV